VRIIGAGLRGGGEAVSDEEVAAMRCDGGAAGFAAIAAELLAVTFGRPAAPVGADQAATGAGARDLPQNP
jgi:hypothetical protein